MNALTQTVVVENGEALTSIPELATSVALYNPDGTPFRQIPHQPHLDGTVTDGAFNRLLDLFEQAGIMAHYEPPAATTQQTQTHPVTSTSPTSSTSATSMPAAGAQHMSPTAPTVSTSSPAPVPVSGTPAQAPGAGTTHTA